MAKDTAGRAGEYVGLVRRFLAYWVDFLILFGVYLLIQYIQKATGGTSLFSMLSAKTMADLAEVMPAQEQLERTVTVFDQVKGMGMMVGWLIWPGLIYTLGMWIGADGATIGKKIWGIKITKDDGSGLDAKTAVKRYLASLVTGLTLPLVGIGYLWSLWDGKRQMLHDKLVKTVVVRTEKKSRGFLGVLLALTGLVAIPGLVGVIFLKVYRLGKASMPIQYQRVDKLRGEAKEYWQESESLRQEISAKWEDKEAVKELNDKNIAALQSALELEGDNSRLWAQLGLAYTWPTSVAEASPEKALELLKKALEIDPEAVYYSNLVGDQLMRMGRWQEALAQFEESVRLDENDGTAHFGLGLVYKQLGRREEAKRELERSVELYQADNQDGFYDKKIEQIEGELEGL